jgi:hypothetical protein
LTREPENPHFTFTVVLIAGLTRLIAVFFWSVTGLKSSHEYIDWCRTVQRPSSTEVDFLGFLEKHSDWLQRGTKAKHEVRRKKRKTIGKKIPGIVDEMLFGIMQSQIACYILFLHLFGSA